MAEILQYVHKDAFLHRLHPFTKIFFIIIVSLMAIIATDIPFLVIMVIAMLAFAAYGELLRESLQQLKLILLMSVIFILITGHHDAQRGNTRVSHPPGHTPHRGPYPHHHRRTHDRGCPYAPFHDPDLRVPALPDLNPATGYCPLPWREFTSPSTIS